MRILSPILYFGLALFLSIHCYRNSLMDVDLLAYAGNVALADTTNPVSIHTTVYNQPLTPHLRGTDGNDIQAAILRRRASDPYYSALYLPYFSVKPLYVLSMQLAHRLGANVVDASRMISAASYFALAVVIWMYTESLLSALILILPETMRLGQINEPDAMSVMLLLFGLWIVFIKRRDLGVLLLLISIWVRSDNVILCFFVLAYLLIAGRLQWKSAAALALVAMGSVMTISRYGYGWRELYYHTFLGGDPTGNPVFGPGDYFRALITGLNLAIHRTVPIFFLLFLVCFTVCRDRNIREVLSLVGLCSVVYFVVYPSYQPRYYGLFFLTTAIVAVRITSSSSVRPSTQGRLDARQVCDRP